MSLQHAAKHLAAHGRGKDTELIHMDKGEIASLQQIAMAHGGSLTINPQTGLPEAGFLSAMLPMIAGAGLMMIPGMQASAAGLIVGGLQTARTGSLSKGIMAGLGAYGGAGLAGSAGAAGAGSTTTLEGAAAAAPTPAVPASNVMDVSGSSLPQVNPISQASVVGQPIGNAPMTNFQDPYASAGFEGSGMPPVQPPAPPVEKMAFPGAGESYTVKPNDFNAMNASERASAMGRGASFSNAGDFIANNKYTAAGAAASVASGMKKDYVKPEPDKDMGQRYSFTGGKLEPTPAPDVPTYEDMLTKQGNFGRQRQYFNSPTYTAISPTAAKDLYHFADGGPVEQMSNNSMMGVNTMYPMANISTSSYGTPDQMAEGGEAEGAVAESRPSYTYDAQTRKYTAGPSMGGASNQPQDFGASAAAALDNFSEGVARDGLTTPMGSYIPPSSNGIPSYAYNPQTRQYIQMAGGGIPRYRIGGLNEVNVSDEGMPPENSGPLGQLLRGLRKRPEENPGLKYEYNPEQQQYVQQQSGGGISDAGYNLGGYSDGGRLLRGPGDGVSDSIPAVIGKKQPARLADGEFVVPARIVSELGNGSTEAGARKLYAMMDRIQAARKKTVGKDKVAHNSRSSKYLPA
jgi:hypothetical protein